MPHPVVTRLKHSVRRAGRALSFQPPIISQSTPAPTTTTSSLRPSRSFPNLRFRPHDPFDDDDPLQPFPDSASDSLSFVTLVPSTLSSDIPPSSSTTTDSEPATDPTPAPAPTTAPTPYQSAPQPHRSVIEAPRNQEPVDQRDGLPTSKRPLRRVNSSQRLPRLSLARVRSRNSAARSSSFADSNSRPWASGSVSLLSPRSNTDEALWSRLLPMRSSDLRDSRMRRNRMASYSCSDFEIAEDNDLVQIGSRLPDRTGSVAEEDVFGRRRRDHGLPTDSLGEAIASSVMACDTVTPRDNAFSNTHMKSYLKKMADDGVIAEDEEQTIRHIDKAIDSSKGRLRKSANMTRAFRSVIRSGEGLIRRSDLIQATLNSEESKNPSMIILLDPDSCDPSNSQIEGVSSTSEESTSIETLSNNSAVPNATLGFSTSMTAKQCAATLETILREMTCKVTRYSDDFDGRHKLIRLRAQRAPQGSRKIERKIKVMVTIREEDQIRTSVSFKRIPGLYSSRDSHVPLCADIRDRFQREWPAVVEALYIRLPSA